MANTLNAFLGGAPEPRVLWLTLVGFIDRLGVLSLSQSHRLDESQVVESLQDPNEVRVPKAKTILRIPMGMQKPISL